MLGRRVARRHDAAVDAQGFVGEPVDDVGARQHFAARLGQRLALLLRQQARHVVRALAQQDGRLAHDRATLMRGRVAPRLETALRGRQRRVQVLAGGAGHLADLLAGGGVHDVDARAASGLAPFVVDQEKSIWVTVHECSVVEMRPSRVSRFGQAGRKRPAPAVS